MDTHRGQEKGTRTQFFCFLFCFCLLLFYSEGGSLDVLVLLPTAPLSFLVAS